MPDFDDEWFEDWKRRLGESGGNIILALGLRPMEESAERVVMEMPYGPNVRQGTGVFAAGALIQLADVAATMACFHAMDPSRTRTDLPFPLAVQISANLMRNTDNGKAIAEAKVVHKGRTMMVVESSVRDDDGRLLAKVNSTHIVKARDS
ncbi:MAG: PaaI family thioesterase [Dehalococcoidia bacterium]|nr:PaaI family thioesterase [Dehalococcoidia bacterium]